MNRMHAVKRGLNMRCSEPDGSVVVAVVVSRPSFAVALLQRMDAPDR